MSLGFFNSSLFALLSAPQPQRQLRVPRPQRVLLIYAFFFFCIPMEWNRVKEETIFYNFLFWKMDSNLSSCKVVGWWEGITWFQSTGILMIELLNILTFTNAYPFHVGVSIFFSLVLLLHLILIDRLFSLIYLFNAITQYFQ